MRLLLLLTESRKIDKSFMNMLSSLLVPHGRKLDGSQRQTETVWSLTQRKVARGQEVETKKVEDLEVFGVKSPEQRRVWKNLEKARASGICSFSGCIILAALAVTLYCLASQL